MNLEIILIANIINVAIAIFLVSVMLKLIICEVKN